MVVFLEIIYPPFNGRITLRFNLGSAAQLQEEDIMVEANWHQ